MGKLKEYFTQQIENENYNDKKLDQDYDLYLLRRQQRGYISSQEFDLMSEQELDYYYGKVKTS